MALNRELLNQQLVTSEVRTGVYQSADRRICIVVKAGKDGKVHYLHNNDCLIQLATSWKEKFMRDYPLMLHNYPTRRAVRSFAKQVKDGFKQTAEAKAVMDAVLKAE